MNYAERYHDFSAGHRVVGHENKCAFLHGHNYRIHFTVVSDELDTVGRVMDFSRIGHLLCDWLEENWDHRFLAWNDDDILNSIVQMVFEETDQAEHRLLKESIVWLPFNPTAENMAEYLLTTIGPELMPKGIRLWAVRVDETRKCSAGAKL